MNLPGFPTLIAQGERTYLEFVRVQSLNQWWHWILLVLILLLITGYIVMMYRRDSQELPFATRVLLVLLRVAAFLGLLFFFLQLEKRSEQLIVKNSRLAMLIDTSQSMGLRDADSTPAADTPRRIDQVIEQLASTKLLENLQEQHDLTLYRFDQDDSPTQVTTRIKSTSPDLVEDDVQGALESMLAEARRLAIIAAIFLGIAVLALIAHLILGVAVRGREGESWALLIAVICMIIATVTAAVSNLRNSDITIRQTLGWDDLESASTDAGQVTTDDNQPPAPNIDWSAALEPRGINTRLGDALRSIVEKERGDPLAGIVLISDGNSNAGSSYEEAILTAQDAGFRVYCVGIGSDEQPTNVRIVDVETPARVYPGDAFTLTALIQAYGLRGQSVKVQLKSGVIAPGATEAENMALVEETTTVLGEDGEAVPLEFELTPDTIGRRRYQVEIIPATRDLDPRDNVSQKTVQVLDRKNRVLLLAGGPTREYRFVRNQLFRDKEVNLDVLLQSTTADAAQEANDVINEFPTQPEKLFEYDCIVAFDPDWEALSAEAIEMLDRWVAEKAGGLVLVSGPVYTPEWSTRRRDSNNMKIIRALYPVSFYSGRGAGIVEQSGSQKPWPLNLTDKGMLARFLWLEDTADDNRTAWQSFEGVYSYMPVRGPKPGATVYARFSNPDTAIDNKLPIYMASQFYGAGRVFYLGSGEMWRLHGAAPEYFEQFYTKLIRHISEGRLLRDSTRGVLLVDKNRCTLGETVIVRASLTNAQYQPLTDESVEAVLTDPDGVRQPLTLKRLPESARQGTYASQFTATSEGVYRVEMLVPDAETLEVLARDVRVRLPNVEVEQPQRNDALLSQVAKRTGGAYFIGMPSLLGNDEKAPLSQTVVPQDQRTYIPGTPDKEFERRLMTWLLVFLCGVLCLEWTIRRLNKLA